MKESNLSYFCVFSKWSEKGKEFYMKIEKLTDNKIRIIINLDELPEKGMDIHSFAKNQDANRISFSKYFKWSRKTSWF